MPTVWCEYSPTVLYHTKVEAPSSRILRSWAISCHLSPPLGTLCMHISPQLDPRPFGGQGLGLIHFFFFSESTTQTHFLSFEWGPGRGQLCSGLRLQYKWLHHLDLLWFNHRSPDKESQHTHVSSWRNSMLCSAENDFSFWFSCKLASRTW